MGRKPYYELLKDPRWQKKRLEVLESRGWRCELCTDETETLHVHHGAYLKGTDPWDYPDEMLHCLCEGCHTHATNEMQNLNRIVGSLPIYMLENIIFMAFCVKDKSLGTTTEAALCFCNLTGLDSSVMLPLVEYLWKSRAEKELLESKIRDDESEK